MCAKVHRWNKRWTDSHRSRILLVKREKERIRKSANNFLSMDMISGIEWWHAGSGQGSGHSGNARRKLVAWCGRGTWSDLRTFHAWNGGYYETLRGIHDWYTRIRKNILLPKLTGKTKYDLDRGNHVVVSPAGVPGDQGSPMGRYPVVRFKIHSEYRPSFARRDDEICGEPKWTEEISSPTRKICLAIVPDGALTLFPADIGRMLVQSRKGYAGGMEPVKKTWWM